MRTPTPQEIGQAIRSARKAQGLRQDELAGVADVGLRFIVEVEKGKASVHAGKLLGVLEALGFKVALTPPPSPAKKSTKRSKA